jgi:hypothetical protein
MKRLEDMTLLQRCVLAVIIFVVIVVLISLIGYFSKSEAEQAKPLDLYGDVPLDAVLLPIDRKALDEAYRSHAIKLFTVWLTDGARDATHFRNGLRISRNAYDIAAKAIAAREQTLKQQEQAK